MIRRQLVRSLEASLMHGEPERQHEPSIGEGVQPPIDPSGVREAATAVLGSSVLVLQVVAQTGASLNQYMFRTSPLSHRRRLCLSH